MKVLIASSEVVPFAKTGGLADVCGALPVELAKLGCEPVVMMPAYRGVDQRGVSVEPTDIQFEIPIGSRTVCGRLLRSHLPGSEVPVYLVQQDEYFDRDCLYGEDGSDYQDNCERYVFFCRAVVESMTQLGAPFDLVHVNDWQTGLIPAYLKTMFAGVPGYEQAATLMTIHNLAYQGTFWHWDMLLTGLDWKYFNWHQMEYHGDLNLMKTGLVFADALSSVSPSYAREIQSSPLGCGLEGVLRSRCDDLFGILNGVDYGQWDPATDSRIAARYDATSSQEGKAACKKALQKQLGLTCQPDVPLVGIVGRLAEQKGLDLIVALIEKWSSASDAHGAVQWAILGTGEKPIETQLLALAEKYPNHVGVTIDFSDTLAHQIEAGADMFLMPSRYEPCGLNQLYSLKYGTVPVVHATGGLADTIVDTTDETLGAGTATGFRFDAFGLPGLEAALQRACDLYRDDRKRWQQVVSTGMRQDWSWSRSAARYVELYERTVTRHRSAVLATS